MMRFCIFTFSLTVFLTSSLIFGATNERVVLKTNQESGQNTSKRHLPDPFASGFISQLLPGAGYLYNGEPGKAALVAPLLAGQLAPYFWRTGTFTEKSLKVNLSELSMNLFFFSVYDSFQDALDLNGRPKLVVNLPHYTFAEVAFAPFYPKTYEEDNVLRGLVFYGMMGFNVGYLTYRLISSSNGLSPRALEASSLYVIPLILLQSMLIGMGEETYFRGFYYPASSQLVRNKWIGNLMQALYFGACHTQFFAGLGLTAFPYGVGTFTYYSPLLFPASKKNSTPEYRAASSPSDGGSLPDWQYFLSATISAYAFGIIASEWKDGLLKTIAYHGIYDAFLVLGDYLTTGNTGRFYMSLSFKY
jgi:membrane protease YdiL (CAAX protease family)